jgi:hypothetical protein
LFTQGNDGPDSLRIDIPKDKVPRGNRRRREMRTATRLSIGRNGWISTDHEIREGSPRTTKEVIWIFDPSAIAERKYGRSSEGVASKLLPSDNLKSKAKNLNCAVFLYCLSHVAMAGSGTAQMERRMDAGHRGGKAGRTAFALRRPRDYAP